MILLILGHVKIVCYLINDEFGRKNKFLIDFSSQNIKIKFSLR